MDGGILVTREVSRKINSSVLWLDLKSCKSFNNISTKHSDDIKMQIAMALSSKLKYHKYLWLLKKSCHLSTKHLWVMAISTTRFELIHNAQRYALTFTKPFQCIKHPLLYIKTLIKYPMQNAIVGNACILCAPSF